MRPLQPPTYQYINSLQSLLLISFLLVMSAQHTSPSGSVHGVASASDSPKRAVLAGYVTEVI
jgi:hypothetical protein